MKKYRQELKYKLLSEIEKFRKIFCGRHLWARGYFSETNGNITSEAIVEYISNQDLVEQQKNENFKVWNE